MSHLQIMRTTDGRFIGKDIVAALPILLPDGVYFHPDTPPQSLGNGVWRFASSNYIIEARVIPDLV